jgi:hypothetical protein
MHEYLGGLRMNMRLLMLVASLSSCASLPPQVEEPKPSEVEVPSVTPIPFISLACDRTCTPHERKKIEGAERIINEIRHLPCFQDTFLKPEISSELVQTGGLSREAVVKRLSEASAEVVVTYYRKCNGVVGYRNTGSKVIHLNRCVHDRPKTDNDWFTASNAFHETSHVLGFAHDYARTKRRPFSVPYRVNRAVERCEKEMRK